MDSLSSDLASLKIDRGSPKRGGGAGKSVLKWVAWSSVLLALGVGARAGMPLLEAQLFKTEVQTGTIIDVSPSLAVTSLTATGYVIAERRSKVAATVPGRIAKLRVHEGDVVKSGDVLAELDAADQKSAMQAAQARVLSAQAQVASRRASLSELQVQVARQQVLVQRKATAPAVLQDLEARANTAAAEIAAAEAEVKAAQAQVGVTRTSLGRMTIASPMDGTVLDRPLDEGESLSPSTPLLELADMTSLVVEIDVPETRLSMVAVGGPCEVTLDAFPAERLRGRVREIGKRVDRSKATVSVKVEFLDADIAVLPDMSARVSFLTEALDAKALAGPVKRVVPVRAIAQRHGGTVVFVLEDGKVRIENVTVGETTDDGVVLTAGPQAGTRVVLDPPSTLTDGLKVKDKTG